VTGLNREPLLLHEYGAYGPSLKGLIRSLPHARYDRFMLNPEKELKRAKGAAARLERLQDLLRDWREVTTRLDALKG